MCIDTYIFTNISICIHSYIYIHMYMYLCYDVRSRGTLFTHHCSLLPPNVHNIDKSEIYAGISVADCATVHQACKA